MNVFKNNKGMNIVGQGAKIMLFALPALVAAILAHIYFPRAVSLPDIGFIRFIGFLLLAFGMLFWLAAVIQLLVGFPKGKLITQWAYGVVRNPIYSSFTFFVLPAISLITLTWVYFIVSAFLYAGVMLFIGTEEKQLLQIFGKEYENYMAKVNRIFPLPKHLN